jgi:hypothetical protein
MLQTTDFMETPVSNSIARSHFAVFVLTTILAVKVPFSSSWIEASILTLFSATWFMWNLCHYV